MIEMKIANEGRASKVRPPITTQYFVNKPLGKDFDDREDVVKSASYVYFMGITR